MNSTEPPHPWGTYAPPWQTAPLRLLTRLGLSRGLVTKFIRRTWLKHFPAIVDTEINGCKYRLDIEKNTTDGKLLASSKCYDSDEIGYLKDACTGHDSVFVDAGANTGYYSLTLATHGCSKIIAIEPNPPTLNLLHFNVRINRLESVIRIEPVCLGPGGKIPFYCAGGLGDAGILPRHDPVEPIWLDSVPLLDLLRKHDVARVDALKIDIEGAEDIALLPFFANAPKTLWPRRVVIEHCHQDAWKNNVIDFMKQQGYLETAKTRGNLILRLA